MIVVLPSFTSCNVATAPSDSEVGRTPDADRVTGIVPVDLLVVLVFVTSKDLLGHDEVVVEQHQGFHRDDARIEDTLSHRRNTYDQRRKRRQRRHKRACDSFHCEKDAHRLIA
jgi:hypothetical protein